MEREIRRQLFHISVGLIAIAVLFFLGRGFAMAGAFFTIIVGTILINRRLLGKKIPLVQWFEERFERDDAPLPGWGSAAYAVGVLLAITFLSSVPKIAAIIVVLGIGDGLSTIIGSKGKMKIPYNPKKTIEGSLAFFAASLPAYLFIGPAAIPLALVGTLAETMPLIDDNISIPLACTALMLIL